jgi:hypothetical protein
MSRREGHVGYWGEERRHCSIAVVSQGGQEKSALSQHHASPIPIIQGCQGAGCRAARASPEVVSPAQVRAALFSCHVSEPEGSRLIGGDGGVEALKTA